MSRRSRIAMTVGDWVFRLLPRSVRRDLSERVANRIAPQVGATLKPEIAAELRAELKEELKAELEAELKAEIKAYLENDFRPGLQAELLDSARLSLSIGHLTTVLRRNHFCFWADDLVSRMPSVSEGGLERCSWQSIDLLSNELRRAVRTAAGIDAEAGPSPKLTELLSEFAYLIENSQWLEPYFKAIVGRRVLFAGQAYYSALYLSRALRERNWKADVLNWDSNVDSQIYYHGEDFRFSDFAEGAAEANLNFFLSSLYHYDVFHFSNAHGISFGALLGSTVEKNFEKHAEIFLLKALGRKIVYSNNGCQDGVSQTSFSRWGPHNVCAICRWRDEPIVCNDKKNLDWGRFRNRVADYQCTLGGNRADFNDDPRVHEVPEFFCLDPGVWSPDIEIPETFRLAVRPGSIRLFHSVGNLADRTDEDGVNIKTTHIWIPLMERLRLEGHAIEWLHYSDVPNIDLRFYQVQADIFLDMLTFGWFGATAREAMMLGKPVVCYIRPEWLESVRAEVPAYAAELPVVSATPETAYDVLRALVIDADRRADIGRRSREFALKWHSCDRGAERLDRIYSSLILDQPVPAR